MQGAGWLGVVLRVAGFVRGAVPAALSSTVSARAWALASSLGWPPVPALASAVCGEGSASPKRAELPGRRWWDVLGAGSGMSCRGSTLYSVRRIGESRQDLYELYRKAPAVATAVARRQARTAWSCLRVSMGRTVADCLRLASTGAGWRTGKGRLAAPGSLQAGLGAFKRHFKLCLKLCALPVPVPVAGTCLAELSRAELRIQLQSSCNPVPIQRLRRHKEGKAPACMRACFPQGDWGCHGARLVLVPGASSWQVYCGRLGKPHVPGFPGRRLSMPSLCGGQFPRRPVLVRNKGNCSRMWRAELYMGSAVCHIDVAGGTLTCPWTRALPSRGWTGWASTHISAYQDISIY